MRVSKWGSSLAIRLPANVVDVLGLKNGDDIQIEVVGPRHFAVRRTAGVEQVLERLRAYRGRLPADFGFDRLGGNERG